MVPLGYEDDLSGYGPILYDVWCNEPIAWGFELRRYLDSERFEALREHGELQCIAPFARETRWALITKRLSREEAIEKYGEITDAETGPQGGWRSITFGETRFLARQFKRSRP